jgi:hypothetical protein
MAMLSVLMKCSFQEIAEYFTSKEFCKHFEACKALYTKCVTYMDDQGELIPNKEGQFRTELMNISDKLKKELDVCSIQSPKQLQDRIAATQKLMADKVLSSTAIASGLILIVQAVNLYLVFEDIRNAENLMKESKDKVETIKKRLNKLTEMVVEIEKMRRDYTELDGNKKGMTKLVRQMQLKVGRARSEYDDLRETIGNSCCFFTFRCLSIAIRS